jgi:hypothetical protein
MTGGIVARWTGPTSVSTCTECATAFDAMACPGCGQRLEARDLPGRIGVEVQTDAGDNLLVVAERNPLTGGWDPSRQLVLNEDTARMVSHLHAESGRLGGLFDGEVA